MKIDKTKLNNLLRSGLNPEIKTRKQLAAVLGLDPTSLTRWFATRDRLGNPRYPVVPDRHVTKILQLFNLEAKHLLLDDEEFREYCFQKSLVQEQGQSEFEQKNLRRLENIAQRRLSIPSRSDATINKKHYLLATPLALLFIAFGFFVFNDQYLAADNSERLYFDSGEVCWTGYSSALGQFAKKDPADPCHYAKLFHRALYLLKVSNEENSAGSLNGEGLSANEFYITFLSEKLDERRKQEKVYLNIELGKKELSRRNHLKAHQHFQMAKELQAMLNNPDAKLTNEISAYLTKLDAKLP